jgi:hypothetical protein
LADRLAAGTVERHATLRLIDYKGGRLRANERKTNIVGTEDAHFKEKLPPELGQPATVSGIWLATLAFCRSRRCRFELEWESAAEGSVFGTREFKEWRIKSSPKMPAFWRK